MDSTGVQYVAERTIELFAYVLLATHAMEFVIVELERYWSIYIRRRV
jgi:hypothetical protein